METEKKICGKCKTGVFPEPDNNGNLFCPRCGMIPAQRVKTIYADSSSVSLTKNTKGSEDKKSVGALSSFRI